MKRLLTSIILFTALHIAGWAIGRGVPFFMNFSPDTYNAHNRNYDIACDDYGTVFVANFEGLVYYDGATWRKIHTPGISRVTRLAKGANGKMWIGGYNVFGYLIADECGRLQMKLIMSDANNSGNTEVNLIKVSGNNVYVHTTQNKTYYVKDEKSLELVKHGSDQIFAQATDSIKSFQLPDMVRVSYDANWGLQFTLPDNAITRLSETDGLPTNAINYVTYDNRHTLWAATEKGIFCTEVATPYSKITTDEGLKGEVYCVNEIGNTIYIGTLNGLFTLRNGQITDVKEISLACWDLIDDEHNQLIAPTSQGLYVITANGIKKINGNNTFSACIDKESGDYYVGETDGVYHITQNGQRTKIASIEKVVKITDSNSQFLVETIFGSLWSINKTNKKAVCQRKAADASQPKLQYHDPLNRVWQTDANGTNLKVSNDYTKQHTSLWIHPLKNKILNTIYICHDGNIIAGGDFGIIVIDAKAMMSIPVGNKAERPYIRQIKAMGDSVIWGGYSPGTLKPVLNVDNIELPSSCRNIVVTFSALMSSLASPTLYRYRINNGEWSQWSNNAFVEFRNINWGDTKLEIQSQDIFGRSSEISTVNWHINYPWYFRWWAIAFYLIIFIYIIAIFFRWRERRLEQEKQKLEGIVAERTSELSVAYDKQQKISSALSDTLDDLKRTQNDLVRMERTATAGKLTQGLIDRILNPINYINNFSKLTSGLAKDLKEDIEDEKDSMSEDNYEDCVDILDMMDQNLSKIEEHGVNTTRTLRAMEAMLNNHVGALVNQNICPLCRQVVEVTQEHLKADIARCGITIKADLPDHPVMVEIDAESISRVLISLLSNSVYAITKKYEQSPYSNAEAILTVKETDGHTVITIHDNGIGIEDTIKDKVFDPFFTTKPTGEASGVGLYLTREIINDHHGTISLNSEKGEFCEFTITF